MVEEIRMQQQPASANLKQLYTVIGSAGFIGRRLVASLRAAGHSVYLPLRDAPAPLQCELGRVIYCAGLTADYARRPFDTVQAHVGLLSNLLHHASFEHLTYLSSTRLYDSLGENGGVTFTEDAALLLNPTHPRHLYDLSKALGENLCLTAAAGKTSVARLACVYDWSDGAPGFLSEWLQRARHEKTMTIDTASGLVRDYIHLDDVVASLCAISGAKAGGIVNVASGENVSNAELAALFNDNGWRIGLQRESRRQSGAACDVLRLAALGVTPRRVRDVLATWINTQAVHAAD